MGLIKMQIYLFNIILISGLAFDSNILNEMSSTKPL